MNLRLELEGRVLAVRLTADAAFLLVEHEGEREERQLDSEDSSAMRRALGYVLGAVERAIEKMPDDEAAP